MRLYLDVCAIQRPRDDQTQARIRLETEAVVEIIRLCENGHAELVSSDALRHEAAQTPDAARREDTDRVLALAGVFVAVSGEIAQDAVARTTLGFRPLDALHLASAASAGADYFITCDDRLLKRATSVHVPPPVVLSPITFCLEQGL